MQVSPHEAGLDPNPSTMWMRVTQATTQTAGMSVLNFKMATRSGGIVATGAPRCGIKLSMNASAPQSTAKSTCKIIRHRFTSTPVTTLRRALVPK